MNKLYPDKIIYQDDLDPTTYNNILKASQLAGQVKPAFEQMGYVLAPMGEKRPENKQEDIEMEDETVAETVEEKINRSTSPCDYVRSKHRYLSWCNLTECKDCGLVGHPSNNHSVNPCRRCGEHSLKSVTGYWVVVPEKIMWNIFKKEVGYWELKK